MTGVAAADPFGLITSTIMRPRIIRKRRKMILRFVVFLWYPEACFHPVSHIPSSSPLPPFPTFHPDSSWFTMETRALHTTFISFSASLTLTCSCSTL